MLKKKKELRSQAYFHYSLFPGLFAAFTCNKKPPAFGDVWNKMKRKGTLLSKILWEQPIVFCITFGVMFRRKVVFKIRSRISTHFFNILFFLPSLVVNALTYFCDYSLTSYTLLYALGMHPVIHRASFALFSLG